MKTVGLNLNQSISSNCKNKKNFRKNNRMISRSSDQNISPPSNMIYHGLLESPPPPSPPSPTPPRSLYFSYPPTISIRKQQPPLLPLPFPKPINNRVGKDVSCPQMNRKTGNRQEKKPVTGVENPNPISIERLGPDPKNIDLEKFSGSAIFTLSPPPSSLPLPNFFRRTKISCNMEVGGVNLGATDNLRRLLRLQ